VSGVFATDFRRNATCTYPVAAISRRQLELQKMPMRSDIQAVPMRSHVPASAAGPVWSCFVAIISNREFQLLVASCTIGCLVTIGVAILFPGFGELIAGLPVFP
jgi:hypothetical protein